MRSRRIVLVLLLLIAVLAVWAACGGGGSPTKSSSAHTPIASLTPTPTPLYGSKSVLRSIAENAQDAVGFAREEYFACPPYCGGDFQSVQYVETTVGQARDLFDPRHEIKVWETADSAEAVVIVAYGEFYTWCMGCEPHTSGPHSTHWAVVPIGQRGTFDLLSNERYDLTRFGAVRQVPLPLPEWPTPVALGGE